MRRVQKRRNVKANSPCAGTLYSSASTGPQELDPTPSVAPRNTYVFCVERRAKSCVFPSVRLRNKESRRNRKVPARRSAFRAVLRAPSARDCRFPAVLYNGDSRLSFYTNKRLSPPRQVCRGKFPGGRSRSIRSFYPIFHGEAEPRCGQTPYAVAEFIGKPYGEALFGQRVGKRIIEHASSVFGKHFPCNVSAPFLYSPLKRTLSFASYTPFASSSARSPLSLSVGARRTEILSVRRGILFRPLSRKEDLPFSCLR